MELGKKTIGFKPPVPLKFIEYLASNFATDLSLPVIQMASRARLKQTLPRSTHLQDVQLTCDFDAVNYIPVSVLILY